QRALDRVFLVQDRRQPADLVVAELLGPPLRVDPGLLANAACQRWADAVDVAEGNVRRLVGRQGHTENKRHDVPPLSLALARPVARVAANDVQAAVAPHQFTVLTNALHAGSNLHRPPPAGPSAAPIGETIILATQEAAAKG